MASDKTTVSFPLNDVVASDEEVPSFYPPFKWGLDHLCRTNFRMFIQDVAKMKPMPMFPMAYEFCGHPVYRVEIMGHVFLTDSRRQMDVFGVDDGSASLKCVMWKTETNAVDADSTSKRISELNLGSLVSFTGRIKTYQEKNELCVEGFHVVRSWRELILFRSLAVDVYRNQFFLPCRLPFEVNEKMAEYFYEKNSGRKTRRWFESETERAVLEALDRSSKGQMFSLDILEEISVAETVAKFVAERGEEERLSQTKFFSGVIDKMEAKGLVYFLPFGHNRLAAHFCVLVSRNCELARATLRKLRNLKRASPSRLGFSSADILRIVRRSDEGFCLVRKVAVERCLEILEDDNDIYTCQNYKYLPV